MKKLFKWLLGRKDKPIKFELVFYIDGMPPSIDIYQIKAKDPVGPSNARCTPRYRS